MKARSHESRTGLLLTTPCWEGQEGLNCHRYKAAAVGSPPRMGMWSQNEVKGQILVFKERLQNTTQKVLDKKDYQNDMESSKMYTQQENPESWPSPD